MENLITWVEEQYTHYTQLAEETGDTEMALYDRGQADAFEAVLTAMRDL